jgi:hypothetical protein
MMEEIQANVRAQHEQERTEKAARNAGKKDKKRKQTSGGEEKKIQTKQLKGSGVQCSTATRPIAVESNEVLSSLFTTKRDVSLKQRADNLFAINQA